VTTIASSTTQTDIAITDTAPNPSAVASWVGKEAKIILTESFEPFQPNTPRKQIPIGTLTVNPNNPTQPIKTDIQPRTYVVTTTITPDKTPHSELTINGIQVPVVVSYKYNAKNESIFGLRPKLFLASTLNNNFNIQGNLGLSINFIKYKSFSFLTPGIAYTQTVKQPDFALTLAPLEYDFGANLSVCLIVTKSVLREDFSVGLGLSIAIK
jgi:hypothetical protein